MKVNILSTVDNKVLERKEIAAEVAFDGATPSRADLKKAICEKVGANPELVVLRQVGSSYGIQSVQVVAHSYSSKEAMAETEPAHIRKREGMEGEKAEGAASGKPAEAKPEQKAEEKKKE